MTTEGTKPGMGAVVKGALGAAVIAVAGFFGTAVMNVLSAPKDSVAYDLIQSMTGMLKGGQQQAAQTPAPAPAATPAPAPAAPTIAAAPQPAAPTPAPQETKVAATSPMIPGPTPAPATPKIVLPAPDTPPPANVAPAPDPSTRATSPEVPSTENPPPGSMLERLRQTKDSIEKARAKTAALMATRVLTLQDRAETPICGKTWRVEVTSIAAGRAEVALRGVGDGGEPMTLSIGAPRSVAGDCRVELLMAYEDLTTRRAQLRETKTP